MDRALDALFASVALADVWFAPYTKVEESFNVQATHDLLFWRTDLAQVRRGLRVRPRPRTAPQPARTRRRAV
jgi:hypothetical protein